jgi:predicted dehydrogenase
MKKLKISVIGTGHLGSIHAKLLHENSETGLHGIFEPNREKAAQLCEMYNCRDFNSPDEAIENSDAIIISAPTVNHFEIAEKSILMGKPCFIEKPITATYEEAVKLMALAEERKILVQVGHVERFNPAIAAIKDYDIDPKFIEAHRLSQFKPRAIDVSVIHDLMIHDIDIILWLIKSKVSSVDANGVNIITDTTDIANARIKFENGAVCNLTASRISARPMRKMRIFQQNAYLSIDFGSRDVEVFRLIDSENIPDTASPATMLGTIDAGTHNKNIYFEKPDVPELNAIAEEHRSFTEAIINGSPARVGAPEAAEALRIAEIISGLVS